MARAIAAIIRHGQYHQRANTPSAHQPFPLTEKGCQQAQNATQAIQQQLAQQGWQLHHEVDCSSLLRAWQTAEILRQQLFKGSEQPGYLQHTAALAERSLGSAANLTVEEIESIVTADPRYPTPPTDWKSNSHYQLPLLGAESLMQSGKRVAAYLQQRMKQLSDGIGRDTLKLFVGHGAAFRHAAYQLGVLKFEQIAELSMYHAEPVYLELLADGSWCHVAGRWKIRQRGVGYND